jgi:hypothetical protein
VKESRTENENDRALPSHSFWAREEEWTISGWRGSGKDAREGKMEEARSTAGKDYLLLMVTRWWTDQEKRQGGMERENKKFRAIQKYVHQGLQVLLLVLIIVLEGVNEIES